MINVASEKDVRWFGAFGIAQFQGCGQKIKRAVKPHEHNYIIPWLREGL